MNAGRDATVRELLVDALADAVGQVDADAIADRVEQLVDEQARAAAAEAVRSLCVLVLRRLQEVPRPANDPLLVELRAMFGEALQQFGGES